MKAQKTFSLLFVLLIVASLMLAACGGGAQPAPTQAPAAAAPTQAPAAAAPTKAPAAPPAAAAVEITYGLWDSAQQPQYEACAAEFTKAHSNIKIKFQQAGWGDYWSQIQTGMVAGNVPDVFTNHLAYYPEFAAKGQLVDIQPLVEKDKVPTDIYIGKLAELWTRNGKRYGLPKDWDTIAVVYNADMLQKNGIDPKVMETWTWNPKDGGTFEQTIAKLTIDKNGKNALDPAFDKKNVVQYGMCSQGSGSGNGQTQWSFLSGSQGWSFQDQMWGAKFNYDDQRFIDTITWWNSMFTKAYSPSYSDIKSLGPSAVFKSAKCAMTTDGSWMISEYLKNTFKVGFGLLPTGPQGRKSMFNGLADSIWTGSKHQAEAWEWLKFMASPACEDIVGTFGVVFPAIQSGVDNNLKARAAKGIDVTAYTKEALDPTGTFLFPIGDKAAERSNIMNLAEESIYLGQTTDIAGTLKKANADINAAMKQ